MFNENWVFIDFFDIVYEFFCSVGIIINENNGSIIE